VRKHHDDDDFETDLLTHPHHFETKNAHATDEDANENQRVLMPVIPWSFSLLVVQRPVDSGASR
jgi:hypothetical protein